MHNPIDTGFSPIERQLNLSKQVSLRFKKKFFATNLKLKTKFFSETSATLLSPKKIYSKLILIHRNPSVSIWRKPYLIISSDFWKIYFFLGLREEEIVTKKNTHFKVKNCFQQKPERFDRNVLFTDRKVINFVSVGIPESLLNQFFANIVPTILMFA